MYAIRSYYDPVINLVLEHFDLDIEYEDTFGLTLQEAQELVNSGQEPLLHDIILNKYNALKSEFDFVLCDGTDFRGKDVITSYSIHYTKLYDLNRTGWFSYCFMN